jgi:hypothetical protein
VLWEIELESAEAAEELQSVALELISAAANASETAKLGDVLVSADGRHFIVTRPRSTAIRFINAATHTFAEKFK